MTNMKPFMNIGPGEFIKEELEERGWRQEDLAEILGLSLKSINQLIKNKQAITIETAKLLSEAFGQSPQYWMNLDTNYRLRLKTDEEDGKDVSLKAKIYKVMPVREMVHKGWLKRCKNIYELSREVERFWDVKDSKFSFLDKQVLPTFRKSEAYKKFNPYYALTWFQMAKTCAEKHKVNKYKKDNLKNIAGLLHTYTIQENGVETFLKELNESGVKFFVLSHLQQTYIDGASFLDESNPVIVYTKRYDRVDNFWFVIAHEITHVLLHLRKGHDHYIDNLEGLSSTSEVQEKEADDLAALFLKSREIRKYFKPYEDYVSEGRVLDCAEKLQIHPALVVGILQHKDILSRTNLNRFKESVSERIPGKYWVEKQRV